MEIQAKEIRAMLDYINMVVDVRKHCSKSCKVPLWLFVDGIEKESFCKRFCCLYTYRKGHKDDLCYSLKASLIYESIESFCYRYCAQEHCNNCALRKYHESYTKGEL